ncbi:efflux RND transporter periplasmic adaptor subunit [Pseudochrobactrum sp. sp1633]|uniref:efflux RND transporter periplasmic adaptor subunit n=1 Tax=Pseudochrobactrum sp. sp1633 TaxID=3036706 RepID=UPI0025A620DB|nr:efflux RND transporter periplasmic adaptor subunit [Pseudochrobactrum sp. sp1633]MDM8344372.1 efflux RND transporter periplasmic adaptor subunit [Pseudochrobactrum sp. sp1633]HWD14496.1 efflux RND transporter periplasmic adaptor subunit [Pseudochrobactrum sp.]
MKNWKQIAVCVVVAAAAFGGWSWYNAERTETQSTASVAPSAGQNSGARNAPLVVVKPAQKQVVNDKLSAIGTGVALNTVAVTPYTSGTIRQFLVGAGTVVKKDQVIAELDAENEQIAVEKAQVLLKDAEITQQRMATLRASNTATQVQVVAADLALATAKLAVKDAQLALSRRSVTAPIAGIVGILPVDAGNYVTSSTTIATIDDRSKLLIDIWVPERFAPQLRIGQAVTAMPTALPGKSFQGQVSAVDNMIDPASRTLRVRAEITNPSDVLRAGMSFTISILFPGDQYLAVDPLSIQWDGDGSYVWRITKDGKVERVAARIIQRNANAVLVDGALTEGDTIVTEGVQNVREGGSVTIKGAGNTASPKEPATAQANSKQAG